MSGSTTTYFIEDPFWDDEELQQLARYEMMAESKNKYAPKGVHIMNRDESKVLRRLMSETSLSEKQIRAIKKYRILLSEAQTKGQKHTHNKHTRWLKNLMKGITQELKLAKEHPKVKEEFKKRLAKAKKNGSWSGYYRSFY